MAIDSFQYSVKLLFERIILVMTIVCLSLVGYYLIYGQTDQLMPNLVLFCLAIVSYALSKNNREKTAYHLVLIVALLNNVVFFFTINSHFYSIVMMGSTMTIYALVFFSNIRVQQLYLVGIILVEFLMFHQAMDETGWPVSSEFWPEYLAGVFHISIVYIIGFYFMDRLRTATENVDQARLDINDKNENLIAQEIELKRYILSNTELENFAFLASHELKSPLRIVKSFVDLITKTRNTLSEEQIVDYLEMVSSNTEKMSNLVDALQDLGSVAQKKVNREKIAIEPFLNAIIEERKLDFENAKIELKVETAYVYADGSLINRLFSNLLGNAIKFKQVNIDPVIRMRCFKKGEFFHFTISDNGIGIKEEKREEVFELFNRQNTYTEYKGMGIGLALCKKIVDMHSGTISINNGDLGGVCFEVRIPYPIS